MAWEWRFPATDEPSTPEDRPRHDKLNSQKLCRSSTRSLAPDLPVSVPRDVRQIQWRCNMTRKLLPIVIVLSVWSGTAQASGAERKDLQIANDVSKAGSGYP